MLLLPATLSAREARDTLRMLKQTLEQERGEGAVVVDAGPLQRFDSSALAVLLECRREALAIGKTFSVARMPQRLRELAKVYGVAELLPAAP